jgi:TetR/AcrR family transcriptional regulator of autoinduction and epiphytic fitness
MNDEPELKLTELKLTDRKRASIVDAAVEEFRNRGFYASSMNRIAELAKVSKRTLYRHFDSKAALFDAIVEELMLRVDQIPYGEFNAGEDLAEQLAAVARAEIEFLSSEPVQALARAGLSRVIGEPEAARSVDHDRFHQRFILWLKQAKSAGHFSSMQDTAFAARQFAFQLQAFAFWPPIVRGELVLNARRRNKIIKETVQMFLARYETCG